MLFCEQIRCNHATDNSLYQPMLGILLPKKKQDELYFLIMFLVILAQDYDAVALMHSEFPHYRIDKMMYELSKKNFQRAWVRFTQACMHHGIELSEGLFQELSHTVKRQVDRGLMTYTFTSRPVRRLTTLVVE